MARHLENYHCLKPRPTDDHGQNIFAHYRHLIEQEMHNDELTLPVRRYLAQPIEFKLGTVIELCMLTRKT